MPSNYFAEQTPPLGIVRPLRAELVQLAASADQIGAMVLASETTPLLAPIPSLAAPNRTDELGGFVPPYTTKSYGKPPFQPALPQDVWDDLNQSNPHYAT